MEEVIAILYAMSAEASLIAGRLAPLSEVFTEGGITARAARLNGQTIVLMQTGIGGNQSTRAVARLAERFDVKALFSIGYAGALDPRLKAGDLLLPGTVVKVEGLEEKEAYRADGALHRLALSIAGLRDSGSCKIATTDRFIPETERKRELFEKTGARAVEMESSAVAAAASNLGIPVAFARAISDEADFDLSAWHEYVSTSRRAARGVAGPSPEILAITKAFSQRAQLASRSLAAFADRLFESLSEQGRAGGPAGGGRLR